MRGSENASLGRMEFLIPLLSEGGFQGIIPIAEKMWRDSNNLFPLILSIRF